MAITAQMVKELRERSGAGMMECKKALVATEGDIEAAMDKMRKEGQAKADKKSARTTAEGIITLAVSDDAKFAVAMEVNSETDFVARDENFKAFAAAVTKAALAEEYADVESFLNATLEDGQTIEQARQALVAKIGENINVRRLQYVKTDGVIGQYLHGGRIGVLVNLSGDDVALAKDLAMHIAASRPAVVSQSDVPQSMIDKEREIFEAQAQESGKPQEIIEKMVGGRINKFLDEVSLHGQPFVKQPDTKVSKVLQEKGATVNGFVRFEVGEGIEKKADNFVEEVMAQVRDAE